MSRANNLEFLRYLPLTTFDGRKRLEFNLQTADDIRWGFGLPKNTDLNLMELLESPKNVLSDSFCHVFNSDLLPTSPIDYASIPDFDDVIKNYGMIGFAQAYPEEKRGKAIMKKHYGRKRTPAYQITRYKRALNIVRSGLLFQDFSNIDEIKTLLQSA